MSPEELEALRVLESVYKTACATPAHSWETDELRRAISKKIVSLLDEKPGTAEKDTVPF